MSQYLLEQTIKAHLKRAGISQRAAAQQLHYTPDQFNKWIKGTNRMPDTAIQALAGLLDLTEDERVELFEMAGYVALNRLNPNGHKTDPPTLDKPMTAGHCPETPTWPGHVFFLETAKTWSMNFFDWPEASDHQRSSWAGMVIYGLSVVTTRMGAGGWLKILLALALWVITAWLVAPILQWPLDDVASRQLACLKYGVSTVLVPLLVAFVTQPDRYNEYRPTTFRAAATIWLLKLTGALVGFFTFSAIALGLAMVWYYVFSGPLPTFIRIGLTLMPLFFGYVTARRIPVDRHKLFNGVVKFHQADYLFLGTFLVAGLLLALFVYYFYWFLSNWVTGFLILLVGIGIAWWEQRRDNGQTPKKI